MYSKLSVLCLFVFFSCVLTQEVIHDLVLQRDPMVPLQFPKESDSAPIVTGTSLPHIPPKKFPSDSSENPTGPPVLSVTDTANITRIKNSHIWLNRTQNMEPKPRLSTNTTTSTEKPSNTTTKVETPTETAEQKDMMNSKYSGGMDVDELRPVKKATETDDKKNTQPKKDLNSEVDVSPSLDKKGPRLMNDTLVRPGQSVLEGTSKMVAVSSSMLSRSPYKHSGIIEPAKTIVTVLLSAAFILGVGIIGLLIWRKIALRRFGRDVLINEEDFDEVSDMHSFDRAQIQIT